MPTKRTRPMMGATTKNIKTSDEFGVISTGDEVVLKLPVPPSANRYWRTYNGRVTVSAEASAYKSEVGWLCSQVQPLAGDVAVSVTVYRERKAGDLDNYLKVLLDALKGILYPDDKAVVEIQAYREDDKDDPRVMVTAWRKELST
jgi:crossover junction endodeoxyribonuclease RusA